MVQNNRLLIYFSVPISATARTVNTPPKTHRELVSRRVPCRQIRVIISIRMPLYIIGDRPVGGITTHTTFWSLVDPDVIDKHLCGEGQVRPVDELERVCCSEIDGLSVSTSSPHRVRFKEAYHRHRFLRNQTSADFGGWICAHRGGSKCPGLLACRHPVYITFVSILGIGPVLEACSY